MKMPTKRQSKELGPKFCRRFWKRKSFAENLRKITKREN